MIEITHILVYILIFFQKNLGGVLGHGPLGSDVAPPPSARILIDENVSGGLGLGTLDLGPVGFFFKKKRRYCIIKIDNFIA